MLKNLINKLNKKAGDILFGEDKVTVNYRLIDYWLSEAEQIINVNLRLAFLYVKISNNAYGNYYHPDINSRINNIVFKLGDYIK